jgi:hypothetical protein
MTAAVLAAPGAARRPGLAGRGCAPAAGSDVTETGAASPGDGGTGGHWVVWSAPGRGYVSLDLLLIAGAIEVLREMRARQQETDLLLAAFGYIIAAREPGTAW